LATGVRLCLTLMHGGILMRVHANVVKQSFVLYGLAFVALAVSPTIAEAEERWTAARAQAWYDAQPWPVGCNFLPSTSINQIEMWQADTFDPATIDRELGWAQQIGFNTVRVFLHDVPWKDDREGFHQRVARFLEIAAKHNIRTMFVIFDGVWDPDPQSGPQRQPRPGVHNSGWVQSPGRVVLADPAKQDALKEYVTDIFYRYGQDERVLAWDLFNEPDNPNTSSYGPLELKNKKAVAEQLVRRAFEWLREVAPQQPATVGIWAGDNWHEPERLQSVQRISLELSDVVSFHDYGGPESMQLRIDRLRRYGRPLLCTEFMARGNGSTFGAILPILKRERVAGYCWGLVDGKSQTKYPWSTWQMPIIVEPDPWHHDLLWPSGLPYDAEETKLVRDLMECQRAEK